MGECQALDKMETIYNVSVINCTKYKNNTNKKIQNKNDGEIHRTHVFDK